jgi:AbiV family abortive infection protein
MRHFTLKTPAQIKKLSVESFKNAYHFHIDSALMFGMESFASSTFLSIHTQEELGKFLMLDDLLKNLRNKDKSLKEAEVYLRKTVFNDHIQKQTYFGVHVSNRWEFEAIVANPARLNSLRQKALFVGVNHSRKYISLPQKIGGKKQATTQIRFTNTALQEIITEGYYKQHKYSLNDDEVDLQLTENTITSDLFFIDNLIAKNNSSKDIEEITSIIKNHKNSIETRVLLNSYKLFLSGMQRGNVRKTIQF